MEKALTLKEVAELLGLSYGTIFQCRHKIGFRLPGSRVWRVWPADLEKLRPKESASKLSHTLMRDYDLPAVYRPLRTAAARKAERELDKLLAERLVKKKR